MSRDLIIHGGWVKFVYIDKIELSHCVKHINDIGDGKMV